MCYKIPFTSVEFLDEKIFVRNYYTVEKFRWQEMEKDIIRQACSTAATPASLKASRRPVFLLTLQKREAFVFPRSCLSPV